VFPHPHLSPIEKMLDVSTILACALCGFLGKTSCIKFMKAQSVVDTIMRGTMSGLQMTDTSLVVTLLLF
jgi:hypothetical protein